MWLGGVGGAICWSRERGGNCLGPEGGFCQPLASEARSPLARAVALAWRVLQGDCRDAHVPGEVRKREQSLPDTAFVGRVKGRRWRGICSQRRSASGFLSDRIVHLVLCMWLRACLRAFLPRG